MINKVSRLSLSLRQFIERRTGFAVSSSSKRSPIPMEGGLRHTVEDTLSRLTDFFADIYIWQNLQKGGALCNCSSGLYPDGRRPSRAVIGGGYRG